MKATVLRLTLAAALALGGLTACKKSDEAQSDEMVGGKPSKIKKDGTNKKEKKREKKAKKAEKPPNDPIAPSTPAPPAR